VPTPYGGKTAQILVDLNPVALQAKGLSPLDVVNAIGVQNLILPAGSMKIGAFEHDIARLSAHIHATLPPRYQTQQLVGELSQLPPRITRRHEWKKLPVLSTIVPNSPASSHTPLQLGHTSISTESHVSVASSWPHFGQCIQCSSFNRAFSAFDCACCSCSSFASRVCNSCTQMYSSSVFVCFMATVVCSPL